MNPLHSNVIHDFGECAADACPVRSGVSGTAPGSSPDTEAAPTSSKEGGAMTVLPVRVVRPVPSIQDAALELLAIHREMMGRERRTRLALIHAARRAGLTNQAIGEALGLTGDGVRKMIRRDQTGAR